MTRLAVDADSSGRVIGVREFSVPIVPANQLPIVALTVLNVPLTLVPNVVTIVMHATRIRASITAYSTAVGPSSLSKKREM
jgi:hypothetical protein